MNAFVEFERLVRDFHGQIIQPFQINVDPRVVKVVGGVKQEHFVLKHKQRLLYALVYVGH